MGSFYDLEVWKQCRLFRNEISLLSKKFPKEEKYCLTDQIVRSSRSVTANIAEGMEDIIFRRTFNFAELHEDHYTKYWIILFVHWMKTIFLKQSFLATKQNMKTALKYSMAISYI